MLTLLIPTLNRSHFIIPYLKYLEKTSFDGSVFIGDSSNDEHLHLTKKAIDELNGNFQLNHYILPGKKIAECIRHMLPAINYRYAMYIGVDDLLVPKTLKK